MFKIRPSQHLQINFVSDLSEHSVAPTFIEMGKVMQKKLELQVRIKLEVES